MIKNNNSKPSSSPLPNRGGAGRGAFKHLIILGDGMADWHVPSLQNKTLLQHASTPAMDWLAAHGRCGLLKTVPDGFHPGSEVANSSILGYDQHLVYEGRGPLEAAAIGVELQPGDLPPVLDVEIHPQDISAEDFRQGILEWLARVEQHYGVRPILYTYHSFRQQYMNDPVFDLYPYWIAHYYVDSVRYKGAWAFWQHSDRGQLPGIKEKVDLNIFNGTYKELQQLAIQAQSSPQ